MFIIILLTLAVLLNFILAILLLKAIKRLIYFDNLFEVIADDLDEGIDFFTELLSKPVFTNSPEINVMLKNIRVLRERMMLHAANIGSEKTSKKKELENSRRPVVVD